MKRIILLSILVFISTWSISGHLKSMETVPHKHYRLQEWLPNNGLKVLTFNIGALAPFGKITNPETVNRVEELCHYFEASDYDVILLQEVWTTGYRKRLKRCGFEYVYHKEEIPGLILKKKLGLPMAGSLKILAKMASLFMPKNYGFDKGLMILSRYPFIKKGSLRFSINGVAERAYQDGEFPVNKGALLATIDHPILGAIDLINTHLVSQYGDYRYDEQRANQLRELLVAIEEFSEAESLILGGDFNMSPPGPEGESRRHDTDFLWRRLRNTLLKDFSQADLPYEHMTTYPDRSGNGLPTEGVLDHLFTKGSLVPKTGKIVFKDEINCGQKRCFPSDHFGLETIFKASDRSIVSK